MIAVTAMILLTALVIAAWKFGGHGGAEGAGRQRRRRRRPPRSSRRGVSVTAARGASFMEVRAAPGAGKPLYRGTLERGQVKRFAPQKLTITLTSPGNVIVRVAGVRVKVPTSGQLTLPRGS